MFFVSSLKELKKKDYGRNFLKGSQVHINGKGDISTEKFQGYSKVIALQFLADFFNGRNDISWLCCALSLMKNPITLIKITPSGFNTSK